MAFTGLNYGWLVFIHNTKDDGEERLDESVPPSKRQCPTEDVTTSSNEGRKTKQKKKKKKKEGNSDQKSGKAPETAANGSAATPKVRELGHRL